MGVNIHVSSVVINSTVNTSSWASYSLYICSFLAFLNGVCGKKIQIIKQLMTQQKLGGIIFHHSGFIIKQA